jgi:hypothetical protein
MGSLMKQTHEVEKNKRSLALGVTGAGLAITALTPLAVIGIACIEKQAVARKILLHLGLPAEPLPTARAQAPPVTLELFHAG